MMLREITDLETWEEFHRAQPMSQFLQSWAWGEFKKKEGAVRRFAIVDEKGKWLCAVQMERRTRRFGMSYWMTPRGPVFLDKLSREERRDVIRVLCIELQRNPEFRHRILFWRFEPVSLLDESTGIFPLSFRRTTALNPASTLLLDLSKSLDELQSEMHEKTRYNIRLASRRGVRVREANSAKDVDAFLQLMTETMTRDQFIQHDSNYLRATYERLQSEGMAKLRLAEHEGKIIAANLEVFYGDTWTYLYGASSSESRNVMAPYALQWAAIQEAKTNGYRWYDFWGTNPQSKAMWYYKPSWEGITRFKLGWGGVRVNFIGTWDLPLHQAIYRLIFRKNIFA